MSELGCAAVSLPFKNSRSSSDKPRIPSRAAAAAAEDEDDSEEAACESDGRWWGARRASGEV